MEKPGEKAEMKIRYGQKAINWKKKMDKAMKRNFSHLERAKNQEIGVEDLSFIMQSDTTEEPDSPYSDNFQTPPPIRRATLQLTRTTTEPITIPVIDLTHDSDEEDEEDEIVYSFSWAGYYFMIVKRDGKLMHLVHCNH